MVAKNGTHNVKIYAEKRTKKRLAGGLVVAFASWFVNKLTTSQVNKLAN